MTAADDSSYVTEYEPFVRSIALKLVAQLDLKVDMEDLHAFGVKGLVEARSRYDASRGVQFNTFAYYRIRGAMLDGIRLMAYMPRRIHQMLRTAEATDLLVEPLGEIRAAPGAPPPDILTTTEVLDDVLTRLTASYVLASLGQGEEDKPDTPEELFASASERARVSEVVQTLPDRERALVQGFYFDGRTLDDIAKDLGISKSWASRLHTKALELLRDALDEA